MKIYKATNSINQQAYIGLTKDLPYRQQTHIYDACHDSETHFHRAIRKYGIDVFIWEILAECNTRKEAGKIEIQLIAEHNTFHDGYNMTTGGEGTHNYKHSQEVKGLISAALRKRSSSSRKKGAEKMKGHDYWGPRTFSEESCQKKSESLKVYYSQFNSEERASKFGKCGYENGFYNKKHTVEAKEKMSKWKKEHYTASGNPFYNKKHTEESRLLISQNSACKGKRPHNRDTKGQFGWFTDGTITKFLRIAKAPHNWARGRNTNG